MHDVPLSPKAFFTGYLVDRFAAVKDKVAGKSSLGSLAFVVPGVGAWTVRLTDGALVVTEQQDPEALVTITVPEADFEVLFVESARAQELEPPSPEKQLFAWKALGIDAQRAKLVRAIPGSMAFVVSDGDATRRMLVTPAGRVADLDAPECRLECKMEDFRDMQSGKQQPLQLIMGGKMKIVGNAQIPMALSTVLA